MTTANIPNTTEQRYQQATQYFTQTGMVHALKRQWEFLKESDQQDFLMGSILLTITTIGYCTHKGIELGKGVSRALSLGNEKKQIVILSTGSGGFLIGLGLSVAGNGLMIEHSSRIEKWKEAKMNQIVGNLMLEEFENDPIWSQFTCPISQSPMFVPTRTPGGQVFDFDSLMKAADSNGIIKDIYNKRIPAPTINNPNAMCPISYSVGACLKDSEMMIVIYKRFRHLATVKSMENGLSTQTRQFFMSYRNALGEFVKPIYMELEAKITKKRNDAQSKEEVTEEEAEQAESLYNHEMNTFKELFGNTPLSDMNWEVERDWVEILNKRWIAEYHS